MGYITEANPIGFIAVWRKLKKTSFYKDSYAVHLAVHLLIEANCKSKTTTFNGEDIHIRRGSVITGRHQLSTATGLKPSTVNVKMRLLERVGFISVKRNNKFSIVTICKYESYQYAEEHDEQQSNNKVTTEQQQSNNKVTHLNKDNKDNKGNKKISCDLDAICNLIYQEYPRHIGPDAAKAKIRIAIGKLAKSHDDPGQWLLDRVRLYAEKTKDVERRYRKLPVTWFNQGCYNDDPDEWGVGTELTAAEKCQQRIVRQAAEGIPFSEGG